MSQGLASGREWGGMTAEARQSSVNTATSAVQTSDLQDMDFQKPPVIILSVSLLFPFSAFLVTHNVGNAG